MDLEKGWEKALWRLDFEHMPITSEHARHVEVLPWHRRDPLDRLLVARAVVENHAIVSADPELDAYDIEVIWQ